MGKDLKGNSLGKGFSQRKDGRYYYRYTNRFGERTKPIYDTSLTRLKRRVKLETSKNDLKLNSKNEQPTLNEFFDMWLNIYKKNTIKETTMKSYENVYNRHLYDTQLGKKQLDKITVLDVKKTYNEIIDADYSQSELGYVKSIIDSMFDLAVAENYVNTNQFKFLKPVSNKRKKKVEPLSKEEQDMFLSYAKGSYYYNLFIFLFNTGLRAGEVAGVLIDDIDLKNRILENIHLTYDNQKNDYKRNEYQKYPKDYFLTPTAINFIQGNEKYVFLGFGKNDVNAFYKFCNEK